MTRRAGFASAALAAMLALAGCGPPRAADRASVERIVHDYLISHPEVLAEAGEALRARGTAQAIAADRAAIEAPFAGAWAGSAHPKATLVMFSDYACGYCRASAPDIARLIGSEPDLRIVWREIPVLGPPSETAAKLALAAAQQGRYLPFHQGVFAAGRPDGTTLMQVAAHAGLDGARLTADAASPAIAREIATNLKLAGRIGVSGTPAFVVKDRLLSGAVGYDALKRAVDQAMGRAGAG